MAEQAARDLMAEGESSNTRLAYRAAMRYWAAWFGARYGRQMALPVSVPVVVQFIVDHAQRSTKAGLEHQLPPAIDEALVEAGFKGKLGAPALNTLMHRVSVLSMAHHLSKQPNPCADPAVKALLSKTRKAYVKRNALPRKQRALTKEPMEAVLETCDDSLKGKRDRALLLFAWASGGRRRSEVSEAVFENLHRADEGTFLYTLASSKTNHNGKARPEDVKPMVGSAAVALEAWLKASGITAGPLFRPDSQEREAGHRRALGDGGSGHREGAVCGCGGGRGFLGALAALGVRDGSRTSEHALARNDGDDGASERGYGGGVFPSGGRPGERGGSDDGPGKQSSNKA